MALTDNLVSYWPLDETSGTRSDSHGTNHLTDNATVLFATGKQGNAADFEHGNAEYLSITSNSTIALDSDQAFTWCFWFYAESFAGITTRPIAIKGGGGLFEYAVVYDVTNNQMELQVSTTGSNGFNVEQPYSGNLAEWHFIVCWHDPIADQLGIQLDNGTPITSSHAGGTFAGTGALNIGRNPLDTGKRWDGLMDEIGLWKRVLTTAERTFLYNAGSGRTYAEMGAGFAEGGLPVVTITAPAAYAIAIDTLLTAYYRLEESSGSRKNVIGTGDITDNNAVNQVTGKLGSGAYFGGSNQYLSQNDSPFNSLATDTPFTWHFWFKPDEVGFQPLVFKGGLTGNLIEYTVYHTRDSVFDPIAVSLQVGNGSSNALVTDSSSPEEISTWHRVCVWHDPVANVLGIQIDNQTPVTTAWTGGTQNTANSLHIGRYDVLYYTGALDEISFHKKVLSTEERAYLWNGGNGNFVKLHGAEAYDPEDGGNLFDVFVTVPVATTQGNATASGAPGTVTVSPPEVTATGTATTSSVLGTIQVHAPTTLLTDLISYWRFNETSGTRNDAIGTNHLTDVNTVLSASGKVGLAADFESSNSEYLSIASNSTLSLNSDQPFTWNLWFKAESLPSFPTLVNKGNHLVESIELEYFVAWEAGNFLSVVANGSSYAVVRVPFNDTTNWHRLCFWHDPITDVIGIQLDDGAPVLEPWSGGTFSSTNPLLICGLTEFSSYWDGLVDEVGFWKRVLTSTERTELWNDGNGHFVVPLDGSPSGSLSTVATSSPESSATGLAAVSSGLPTVTLLSVEGTTVGEGSGSSSAGEIALTPVEGTVTGEGLTLGSLAETVLTSVEGMASGGGLVTGLLDEVALTPVEGTASGVSNTSTSGLLGEITLTPVEGTAAGTVNASTSGLLSEATLIPVEGTAVGEGSGSGSAGEITLIPVEGTGTINVAASGPLGTVTVTPVIGQAEFLITTEDIAVSFGMESSVTLTLQRIMSPVLVTVDSVGYLTTLLTLIRPDVASLDDQITDDQLREQAYIGTMLIQLRGFKGDQLITHVMTCDSIQDIHHLIILAERQPPITLELELEGWWPLNLSQLFRLEEHFTDAWGVAEHLPWPEPNLVLDPSLSRELVLDNDTVERALRDFDREILIDS